MGSCRFRFFHADMRLILCKRPLLKYVISKCAYLLYGILEKITNAFKFIAQIYLKSNKRESAAGSESRISSPPLTSDCPAFPSPV